MNIFIFTPENNRVTSRPDTSVARNIPLYYMPDYLESITFKAAIGIKISRAGKSIKERFIQRYFDKYFPAYILYGELRNDYPNPISPSGNILDRTTLVPIDLIPAEEITAQLPEFDFSLNGLKIKPARELPGLSHFGKIVEYLTEFSSVKKGDMIIVEISDMIELKKSDIISVSKEGELLIETEIR